MDIAELRHTFSTRIRKLRAGKLNQGKFADSVGISRGAMSYYEQESRTPDIGVLRAICVKYNISADYLLGIIPDSSHSVSDICRETGLSPESARKLNLIARMAKMKSTDPIDMMETFDQAFLDVMKLAPFTSVPEVLNLLLENEEGLDLLVLLGAILLGAELSGGKDARPSLKIKSAVKGFELEYPIQNIAAALWVNIQSDADKLRAKQQAEPPQPE